MIFSNSGLVGRDQKMFCHFEDTNNINLAVFFESNKITLEESIGGVGVSQICIDFLPRQEKFVTWKETFTLLIKNPLVVIAFAPDEQKSLFEIIKSTHQLWNKKSGRFGGPERINQETYTIWRQRISNMVYATKDIHIVENHVMEFIQRIFQLIKVI